jgi:2-polyprenyl-3-methyl-5-hydroxy-6-metoxy-1,4-benzoquinol methylase
MTKKDNPWAEQERELYHIVDLVADQMFPAVKGMRVLELGSFSGWFTAKLLDYTGNVTCLEMNKAETDQLAIKFPQATVINDDFHTALRSLGEFDAVVVYGVLYHSCAPLLILEDIVNYSKPKLILMESFISHGQPSKVSFKEETTNEPGMRQSKSKTCGFVFSLSDEIYTKSLENMGYRVDKTWELLPNLGFKPRWFKNRVLNYKNFVKNDL